MIRRLIDSPFSDAPVIDDESTDVTALQNMVKFLYAATVKQAEDIINLTEAACFDPLTHLMNRRGLEKCLGKMMSSSQRDGSVLYMMHVDLDNFSNVNNEHGHAAGDEVLLVVANRLVSVLRANDIVARLGGDEFLIVMQLQQDANNHQLAEQIARRITTSIKMPVKWHDTKIQISASLGGVEYSPHHYVKPIELIKLADEAMYQIKKAGKAGFVIQKIED